MRVRGEILGMKSFSYQSSSLEFYQAESGDYAGQERYSQVDENALCNLGNGDIDQRSLSNAQGRRQYSDENISIDGIKQHLKYGVQPHQGGAVLSAAAGQLVPDDDHGDAARQADEDYAVHEVRMSLAGKLPPGRTSEWDQ